MREKIASEDYIEPISHDGVHDSLTYLAAPSFFYEILHREIARANRDDSPLTLFRFTLQCQVGGLVQSQYELTIINFANAISRLTRDSDVTARVGRFEFFTLLPVARKQGINFIDRLMQKWGNQDFFITHSFVEYRAEETLLDLLNRLDSTESASV
jgi:GGDEF domain-containing protein